MPTSSRPKFGAKTRTVDLSEQFNWPQRVGKEAFWQKLADEVRSYPQDDQEPWGIPFTMAGASGSRVILAARGKKETTIPLRGKATHLCVLHKWCQIPNTVRMKDPTEGLVVAEYELIYTDRTRQVLPVRARFEVGMEESPGPPWLAVTFGMPESTDPVAAPDNKHWGSIQPGIDFREVRTAPCPLLCVMPNPCPDKRVSKLVIRGLQESPLVVAGLTLYEGSGHPLRHLPRRIYRVNVPGKPAKVEQAAADLGTVTRIERTTGPRGAAWLKGPQAGTQGQEPDRGGEDLVELAAADDATLSVTLSGRDRPMKFSVGEAFHGGRSRSGKAKLEVLGRDRQWMQITVIDASTGQPTPVRVHFSGSRGEYLAPYGHHAQINTNWFEDYGADVVAGGRNYAYVAGRFTTDMPVGDVYVEINKGFEYQPIRQKVTIRPGQKELKLKIKRWKDLRSQGWVTADTHVHFISPHTAWLEGQCEGVNVVNLLASQWGRLFTNVGDLTGKPGVVQDDTIVFVGTENRNHMLGHMSMLGTQDIPVYPMCCGGVSESWIGDPDFRMLAEWALENKRKGGVVIRPHYPYCGHTEDPVPILAGLVDALEVRVGPDMGFPVQEWYRYLNCGYRVAVCGGTDKMGAYTPVGWMRTYAQLDPDRPFTYAAWARAVRAGRTISTNGPLMDLTVDGQPIAETIRMPEGGGTVEVRATAECFVPMGKLELVVNGRVVARARGTGQTRKLVLREKVRLRGSGWIAARCSARAGHAADYMAAHTSPVYVQCGRERPFNGPAAEHMLGLVEGGIEYLNTLATVFDESSRKRMVKLFKEAQRELKGRLLVEADTHSHTGHGHYHTHGHGVDPGHTH